MRDWTSWLYLPIWEHAPLRLLETEDKDWINNWKQYFKPFTVDHILIKPTWGAYP